MSKPTIEEMVEAIRTNNVEDEEICNAICRLLLAVGEWKKRLSGAIQHGFDHGEEYDKANREVYLILSELRDFGEEGKSSPEVIKRGEFMRSGGICYDDNEWK